MKKISLLILTVIFTINITNADPNVNNRLSFDIGGVIDGIVKSAQGVVGKIAPMEYPEKQETQEQEYALQLRNSSPTEKTDWNACEVYDATYLNTIDLDVASTKAIEKIGKIEDTIEEEALLREEIFEKGNDKNKKLTDLQKKERIVFREMRKEIEEAKKFYKRVDEAVLDAVSFLETTDCDVVSKKEDKQLREIESDTEELVTEEGIFRKTFSSSLKDKMSILQSGVKDAVK